MRIVCDYLTFSVEYEKRRDILDLIPVDVVPLEHGFQGYTHSALIGSKGGRVCWSPDRRDQKAHFIFPGQALAELAGVGELWADLSYVVYLLLYSYDAKVKRFDVAWDDFDGILPHPSEIQKWTYAGNLTSRWKKGFRHEEFNLSGKHDKGDEGHTVYFGSKTSDAQLRIYDKAAERRSKGEEFDGEWIRVELQMRQERAQAIAGLFWQFCEDQEGTALELLGVLRGYIEFKQPVETDSNRRRWPIVSWWSEFIQLAEKARLEVEKVTKTIDDVQAWVEHSVAPSLAAVEKAIGFDKTWAWMFAAVEDGKKRLSKRHKLMIAAAAVSASASQI